MSNSQSRLALGLIRGSMSQPEEVESIPSNKRAAVVANAQSQTLQRSGSTGDGREKDLLLTAEDVVARLNVTKDWVWDHSSRKAPLLPVIRIGDGTLRYRESRIEEFINERERVTKLRRRRG
jgi:predicted DNA-binding transcriptional regulator AlpA